MNAIRRLGIPGRVTERLQASLFVVPATSAVMAVALAIATLALDRRLDTSFWLLGDPASARSLLSTLASAMLSFTGLVFSVTIVALQLASSQWSPRVMRTYLGDRSVKIALATFVATFIYAFVVLRGVRADFLPGVSLTVALALLLLSVGVFVHYINHIAHGLRVSSVIAAIGDEGRAVAERLLADDPAPAPAAPALMTSPHLLRARHPGVLVAFDGEGLVRRAVKAGGVIEIVPAVGAFVPAGAVLLRVHAQRLPDEDPRELLELAQERTTQHDLGFSLRQLVDIAVRALSPGINDPTTAVQSLDRVHDLLRDIGTRPIPSGRLAGEDGETRLVVPAMTWPQYVGLGLGEAIHYAAGHPQVRECIATVLDDLEATVAPERRAALRLQRRRLEAPAVHRAGSPSSG